jgi:hypothetical protein
LEYPVDLKPFGKKKLRAKRIKKMSGHPVNYSSSRDDVQMKENEEVKEI